MIYAFWMWVLVGNGCHAQIQLTMRSWIQNFSYAEAHMSQNVTTKLPISKNQTPTVPLNYIYCNARIPPQTNPQASKRRCPHQPCRRIVHTLVRNYLGFNLWAVSCFLDKPWMQSIGYVPLLGIIYRSLFLWSAIYCGSHIAEYPPGFFRPPPVSWFRQDSHPERLDPAGHF